MNSKFLALSILFLIVPACGPRKIKYPVSAVSPIEVTQEAPACDNVDNIEADQMSVLDTDGENIPGFELPEEESIFSSNINPSTIDKEEELTLVSNEDETGSTGDIHQDSSKYGLKTVFYDFGQKNATKPEQKAALANNLKVIKDLANKNYAFSIEGHACSSAGSESYNMLLSEDRAQCVKNYLAKNGIAKDRVRTVGWGWQRPRVPHGTKEQQSPNRRVEIYAYPQASSK